jgi:hypothetical protein
MGCLKSTAISRLVAMPPLSGTTIDTVGLLERDGGTAPLPQLMRKATARRAGENREI